MGGRACDAYIAAFVPARLKPQHRWRARVPEHEIITDAILY